MTTTTRTDPPDPRPGKAPATSPPGSGGRRRATGPRYPLDPLVEAMGLSINQACLSLGISGSTQQQYRREGVTEKVADRIATRAGFHPFEIWPEMADHILEAHERAVREKDAARNRRRYHRDPATRAYFVEKAAQYRRENPDYVARSNATYRARNRTEIAERERRRYEANREQILARKRARYAARKTAVTDPDGTLPTAAEETP